MRDESASRLKVPALVFWEDAVRVCTKENDIAIMMRVNCNNDLRMLVLDSQGQWFKVENPRILKTTNWLFRTFFIYDDLVRMSYDVVPVEAFYSLPQLKELVAELLDYRLFEHKLKIALRELERLNTAGEVPAFVSKYKLGARFFVAPGLKWGSYS